MKKGIFGPKFRHFCFFCKILQLNKLLFFREILLVDTFEGADFKCDNRFFKIPVQQDKFKDFKYDNSAFKL